MIIREFNQYDYNLCPVAEKWDDGSLPLFAEFSNGYISIGDRTCIEVYDNNLNLVLFKDFTGLKQSDVAEKMQCLKSFIEGWYE